MGQSPIAASRVSRGSIVLVPFPFTDLSATKRRPALVVSPDRFGGDDFILCAISSQVPVPLGPWDIRLVASDGHVTLAKQHEVLERLTRLFAPPT